MVSSLWKKVSHCTGMFRDKRTGYTRSSMNIRPISLFMRAWMMDRDKYKHRLILFGEISILWVVLGMWLFGWGGRQYQCNRRWSERCEPDWAPSDYVWQQKNHNHRRGGHPNCDRQCQFISLLWEWIEIFAPGKSIWIDFPVLYHSLSQRRRCDRTGSFCFGWLWIVRDRNELLVPSWSQFFYFKHVWRPYDLVRWPVCKV